MVGNSFPLEWPFFVHSLAVKTKPNDEDGIIPEISYVLDTRIEKTYCLEPALDTERSESLVPCTNATILSIKRASLAGHARRWKVARNRFEIQRSFLPDPSKLGTSQQSSSPPHRVKNALVLEKTEKIRGSNSL